MTQKAHADEFVQAGLAALLAAVAGYVDAYAVLNYKVFVSFISGNTTHTGLGIGQGNYHEVARDALPILCFFVGVFVGTLIEHSGWRNAPRIIFALSAALILLDFIADYNSQSNKIGVITLSLAIGALTRTLTKVGTQPISLGYVTGVLSHAAKHLALAVRGVPLPDAHGFWNTHLRRVLLLLSVWTSLLLGAVLAGAAKSRLNIWTLPPPIAILIMLAIFSREQIAGKYFSSVSKKSLTE